MSKALTLSEQIALLSDPRPRCFDPDEAERDHLGYAKLCDFECDSDDEPRTQQRSVLRDNVVQWDDDPRYAGRPVSRKELEEEEGEEDGDLDEMEEEISG